MTEKMLDEEKTLDEVQEWTKLQKEQLKPLRELRNRLREKLDQISEQELKKATKGVAASKDDFRRAVKTSNRTAKGTGAGSITATKKERKMVQKDGDGKH